MENFMKLLLFTLLNISFFSLGANASTEAANPELSKKAQDQANQCQQILEKHFKKEGDSITCDVSQIDEDYSEVNCKGAALKVSSNT
jgi:hypothetical protein